MSDRVFFSLAALLAVLLIALSAVAPQGLGARAPGPFGRPVVQPPDPHAAAALAGLRTSK
jgi:hypothetical protein